MPIAACLVQGRHDPITGSGNAADMHTCLTVVLNGWVFLVDWRQTRVFALGLPLGTCYEAGLSGPFCNYHA